MALNNVVKFPGFKREYKEGFFRYPNELEAHWHKLSGSEQKLLDFILRRTFGYQKLEDRISLSQFVHGTGKRGGTGVSRAQVQRSLASLEEKGFIRTERSGYQTRLIKLALREDEPKTEKVPDSVSAPVEYAISFFKSIAPTRVDGFMKSKKQVEAMERLLKQYGTERVERYVAAAQEVLCKEFAPVITTPAQLEEKLPQLIAFYNREVEKKKPRFAF